MIYIVSALLLIGSSAILIFALFALIAIVIGAPFVPSSHDRVRTMLKLANIKKGMHVVDLGSGDGRLLVAAATQGARVTGIEINPALVITSKIWLWFKFRSNRHKVVLGDFRSFDLKNADIIFCYHLPGKMAALEAQVKTNAKRGAKVVLHAFAFPNLKPIKTENKIFLYQIQ